jgi:hypothetical protein
VPPVPLEAVLSQVRHASLSHPEGGLAGHAKDTFLGACTRKEAAAGTDVEVEQGCLLSAILMAWGRVEGKPDWEGWVVRAWADGPADHGKRIYVHESWVLAAYVRVAEVPAPTPDSGRGQ